jgi:transposase-like protein
MARRRKCTPEFKTHVVLEELTGEKDKAEICREYRLRSQVFPRWRAEFVERAIEIFATKRSRGDEQEGYLPPAGFEAQWREEPTLVLDLELRIA